MNSAHPFASVRQVWKNGELIAFDQATVHLFSHVLHYGSGWFEGVRCYNTPEGPAIFRLQDHLDRLLASCKIFRVELPYTSQELADACWATIHANGFDSCYIRPLVYRGLGPLGVNPLSCPVEVAILAWPWGQYLGADAIEKGVEVCVSSWRRYEPSTFPAISKAIGGYLNAQLIKMEAMLAGFAEGIALDTNGCLSEGSAENLFLVHKGVLLTPPLSASILEGVTRGSILTLAAELGIPAREEQLPRSLLYTCEELFMTGTAAEVTPVSSVDRIPVGNGRPGPITRRLQEAYLGIASGKLPDKYGWLTRASVSEPVLEGAR